MIKYILNKLLVKEICKLDIKEGEVLIIKMDERIPLVELNQRIEEVYRQLNKYGLKDKFIIEYKTISNMKVVKDNRK